MQKQKIFEFRSPQKIVAVVATNYDEAKKTMDAHGYSGYKDEGGFWLERVYDNTFDEIIVAGENAGASVASNQTNQSTDDFQQIKTRFANRFNGFFLDLLRKVRDFQVINLPENELNPLNLSFLAPIDTATGFETTIEEIAALSGHQELKSFCEREGCLVEISLNNTPVPNEGLIQQRLMLKIGKK